MKQYHVFSIVLLILALCLVLYTAASRASSQTVGTDTSLRQSDSASTREEEELPSSSELLSSDEKGGTEEEEKSDDEPSLPSDQTFALSVPSDNGASAPAGQGQSPDASWYFEVPCSSTTTVSDAPPRPVSSRTDKPKPPAKPSSKPLRPSESSESSKISSHESSSDTTASLPSSSKNPSSESSLPKPPASSSVPTSSDTPQPPTPPPDTVAQMNRKNNALAAEIGARYGLSVTIARTRSDYSSSRISRYEQNPSETAALLSSLKSALSIFPTSFFEGTLTVVITGRLSVPGMVKENDALLIPEQTGSRAMRTELLNVTSEAFVSEMVFDLSPHVPDGFVYGLPNELYVYSRDNPDRSWFLSISAQMSPVEDISQILKTVLENPGLIERTPVDSPFRRKAVYCCRVFLNWRSSMAQNHAVQRLLNGV